MKKIFILITLLFFNITYLNANSDYTKGFMFYQKGHRLLDRNTNKANKAFAKARAFLSSAYKTNSANAAYMLGQIYLNGWGIDKDYSKAEKYFKTAINWGDKRSNCPLARLYLIILKKNIVEGEKYFETAQEYHIPNCKDVKAYIKKENLN